MSVHGLQVVKRAVHVVGDDDKVVAWKLPGVDFTPHARTGIKNSAWTIDFRRPQQEVAVSASIFRDLDLAARVFEHTGFMDDHSGISTLWIQSGGHNIYFFGDRNKLCLAKVDGNHITIYRNGIIYRRPVIRKLLEAISWLPSYEWLMSSMDTWSGRKAIADVAFCLAVGHGTTDMEWAVCCTGAWYITGARHFRFRAVNCHLLLFFGLRKPQM